MHFIIKSVIYISKRVTEIQSYYTTHGSLLHELLFGKPIQSELTVIAIMHSVHTSGFPEKGVFASVHLIKLLRQIRGIEEMEGLNE